MNYKEMSDFEINKLVADRLGFDSPSIQGSSICQRILIHAKDMPTRQEKIVDYCNNPSDAWPIILENRIDIAFLKCEPDITVASNGDDYIRDKNPLRASMIVYLMMGEG